MIELFFALLPIITLILLMSWLEMPAIKAMPVAWASAVCSGLFIWKMAPNLIQASIIKGTFVAIDIALIVFGAIFLLEATKHLGFLESIDTILRKISHDTRVHAIIIAWGFGTFIEGASGFGASQAIIAPLLVGLGIPPLSAIIAILIANSTPVSFGAVGTPITIGIGSSLYPPATTEMLHAITVYTAAIHATIGLFIPLLITCFITLLGPEKSFKKGLEIWKFALFSGATFVIPYLLIAIKFGPLFPSLLGGLTSILLITYAAKKGWFLPKSQLQQEKNKEQQTLGHTALKALFPYLLATALMLITRIAPIKSRLSELSIRITNIANTEVSHTFSPLLSPGTILLFVGIIAILFFHEKKQDTMRSAGKTALRSIFAFITIAFAVGMVQIFLLSGTNSSGFPSIPVYLAQLLSSLTGKGFILLSPMIGAFGAFLSGSNTISNILLAAVQNEVATTVGISVVLMLSLQVVGGAAGNMISIHNILAASASVHLKNEEGKILKYTIIPVVAYCLAAGIIGAMIAFMI